MINFIGWVVFMLGVILAVPIAAMIDRRKVSPKTKSKPAPVEEPVAQDEPAPVQEFSEPEFE